MDYVASSEESDSWDNLPEENDGTSSVASRKQSISSRRIGTRSGSDFGLGTMSSGIGQWKGKGRDDEADDYLSGKPRSFSGPGSVIVRIF